MSVINRSASYSIASGLTGGSIVDTAYDLLNRQDNSWGSAQAGSYCFMCASHNCTHIVAEAIRRAESQQRVEMNTMLYAGLAGTAAKLVIAGDAPKTNKLLLLCGD